MKCQDCGLVGFYQTNERILQETEQSTRATGHPIGPVEPFPVCIANAYPLAKEVSELQRESSMETGKVNLRVLEKDRGCDEFFAWRPGFSPKEHLEMRQAQMLHEEIQKREEADKAWRAEQDVKRREWESQQKAADEARQDERNAKSDVRQEARDAKADVRQDERDAKRREWEVEQDRVRRRFQTWLAIGAAAMGAVVGYFLKR